MMKLAVLFILSATATYGFPQTPYRSLGDDLKEFRALLPLQEIKDLVLRYFATDREFQEWVAYIQSPEILPMFEEIEKIPKVREFLTYLHNHGSDVYELLNRMHELLGIRPFEVPTKALSETNGLNGFFEELYNLLPEQKLKNLYEQKLQTSEDFREFVKYIKSSKFQELINEVWDNVRVQKMVTFMEDRHVDLSYVGKVLHTLFGLQVGPSY